ncbi:MAG: MobA/MobL family protein [Alphaproteobacteria bacterium]|nr:MobA/MobL family protein [Alphaproteobacteria bacterium]
MAIYRLSADIVRRSEGRTVTAAAAYRAGQAILDQRTGLMFDYSRRHGVFDAEILAPAAAPPWIFDRAQLWNRVEATERRKDAQLARDIELALPHELNPAARRDLVHRFVRAAFVDAGMVADVALHAPDAAGDGRNFHAHILLTMRLIEGESFGPKVRAWNDQALLEQWRALWADHVNQALELAGENGRVDHRSLEAQGIDRVAQIHLGLAVTEMRRRGIATERADYAGEIDDVNDELDSLAAEPSASMPAITSITHAAAVVQAPEKFPALYVADQDKAASRTTARAAPVGLFRKVAGEVAKRLKMLIAIRPIIPSRSAKGALTHCLRNVPGAFLKFQTAAG